MKIVGFTGAKYSGKDTAAKALMWDHRFWNRIAFADPLREMLYTLNPLISPFSALTWQESWDTIGYDEMKKYAEVRRLMQVFGTEVMREQFGQDVWVDLTMRKVDASPEMTTWWAVTDVRFDNEAQAIRKRGGQIVELVYTGEQDRDAHGADHASEAGISRGLIDATVYNDGTEDFYPQVIRIVEGLFT